MYILFDVGGTKTRLAASDDLQTLRGEPVVFKSSEDFESDIEQFIAHAKELAGSEEIQGVGGGIAGVLNNERTSLVRSPNKKTWIGKPITQKLSDGLGTDVVLENDTAVVGLGEAHFGAGRGHDLMVYMTISTGVGGTKIEHGKVDDRHWGFEPGHQVINPHCRVCSDCIAYKEALDECIDLEGLVSGTALSKRTGKKPYEVEDEAIWHQLSAWVALGLNNTIVHWSPDAVVLGGSMMAGKLGPVIGVDDIKEHLKQVLHIFPEIPQLKLAELDDYGGLYGAMALLKEQESTQK